MIKKLLDFAKNNPTLFLIYFCVFHFLAVFVLSISKPALSTDMVENLYWGSTWQLGYYKHPPFFAYVSKAWMNLVGGYDNLIFYHALTPLSHVIFFVCIYSVARRMLSVEKLVLSLIFMDGLLCHYAYSKFNANTALFASYGMIIYSFYHAVTKESWRKNWYFWILFGIFCATSMLTKYSSALLILCFMPLLFTSDLGRKQLKNPFLYIGGLVSMALFVPHVIWVFQHKMLPFLYLSSKSSPGFSFIEYIGWILRFALYQIGTCLAFFVAAMQVKKYRKKIDFHDFNTQFLTFVGIAPLAITFVMLFCDAKLQAYWVMTFFGLIPAAFLYCYEIKLEKMVTATKTIIIFFVFTYVAHILTYIVRPFEPIYEVTKFADDKWDEFAKTVPNLSKPKYIYCYDADRICRELHVYSKYQPLVVLHDYTMFGDPNIGRFDVSTWVTKSDLLRESFMIIADQDIQNVSELNQEEYDLVKGRVCAIYKGEFFEKYRFEFASKFQIRKPDKEIYRKTFIFCK